MKKPLMIIPLVFLLCFTFSCTKQAEVSPLSDEDVAAIKATTEAFILTISSEDWTAHAKLYTEDAVLMPPNLTMIRGREAIRAWNKALPPTLEFNMSIVEIDGLGDLAFVLGTYSITKVLEGVSEPIQDTGKFIEIRQKQEDSSWLISRDIYNSDLPLPPPPEKE